jgi:hypothetical protein
MGTFLTETDDDGDGPIHVSRAGMGELTTVPISLVWEQCFMRWPPNNGVQGEYNAAHVTPFFTKPYLAPGVALGFARSWNGSSRRLWRKIERYVTRQHPTCGRI